MEVKEQVKTEQIKKAKIFAIRNARKKEFNRITDVAEDKISAVFGLKGIKKKQRDAIPYGVFIEKFFEIPVDGLERIVEIVIDYHGRIGRMEMKYNKALGI